VEVLEDMAASLSLKSFGSEEIRGRSHLEIMSHPYYNSTFDIAVRAFYDNGTKAPTSHPILNCTVFSSIPPGTGAHTTKDHFTLAKLKLNFMWIYRLLWFCSNLAKENKESKKFFSACLNQLLTLSNALKSYFERKCPFLYCVSSQLKIIHQRHFINSQNPPQLLSQAKQNLPLFICLSSFRAASWWFPGFCLFFYW